MADGPVLLCYDGSDDARAAIESAAAILSGTEVVSVCFWQSLTTAAAGRFATLLELVQEPSSINAREEERARTIAEEGAEIARAGGMNAEARAVEIDLPVDDAIIAYADEIDASVVVLGSRGRHTVSSLLLGDVAHD